MTPEEARREIDRNAWEVSPFHDVQRNSRAIVDVVLSDVPLLMQAIGAEREWICGVSDSGFHNGANCKPTDPHEGWDCDWYFRLTVQEVNDE